MEEIDLSCEFLGKKLNLPLVLNAITGGTPRAEDINYHLACIAKKYGMAMAVGSQTISIDDPGSASTFRIVREINPTGVIIANMGAGRPVEDALAAVEMINADALQLHFNVPQELAMREGDRSFKGIIDNVARIVKECPVPVIAKEVGFGFSRESVSLLYGAGVNIIDVGGMGGTNFIVIEDKRGGMFGGELDNWGIPTAQSLAEVLSLGLPLTVIASGGIRTALDAAKALAMGADLVGIAGSFLKVLLREGADVLDNVVANMVYRLKAVFLMTGADNIERIKTRPVIITGRTGEWLKLRGINPEWWARR
ncbi:isopentenyl-diphosphate delta-isomerase [Thermosyntropha lipolytica DSM 11003]|uniref:Isopentenyl-diphosphate delta-isomerase n=2 Tax=Thermosyntropha TaxID=54293 RepID=A0A1M5QAU8_9FIRM|nr:isopentenyl-diphosphate delta-isomerase [Thermosyntropha lipolytica DSM 11003]